MQRLENKPYPASETLTHTHTHTHKCEYKRTHTHIQWTGACFITSSTCCQ